MKLRQPLLIGVGSLLLSLSFLSLLKAESQPDGPILTPAVIKQLQDLPYGIAQQRCLLLRYRHVGTIEFYGSGTNSRFSFRRGRSLVPEGLSLSLKNDGSFSWASGLIKLKRPLNVSRYNSIVMWVRTSHPGLRFWLGLQDPSWQQPETYQARTDILPFRGFPPNNVVQLVVPFKSVFAEAPINYGAINQIAFEFGEETVGNSGDGDIEILGLAFVRQAKPLLNIKLVVSEVGLPPPATVITRPSQQVSVPSLDSGSTQVVTPTPIRRPRRYIRRRPTASQVLNPDQTNPTEFYSFDVNKPESMDEFSGNNWIGVTQDLLQGRSGQETSSSEMTAPAAPVNDSPKTKTPFLFWPWLKGLFHRKIINALLLGILAGLLAFWWYHRKHHRVLRVGRLGKILHEVRWLFSQETGTPASHHYEADFWKGLAAKNMRYAWLSTAGASIVRSPEDQFYGEEFLRRQVRLASSNGIRLFPSLSFVRTVFNYETFLANPSLYYIRPIHPDDLQLNDDELRAKEKDAFPVWIPPFWQKKFRLPHRVLVEYGRSIGMPHSRDNVEFNRASPAMKKIALQTIDHFASMGPGVRIEKATWLLNSKISGTSPSGKKLPTLSRPVEKEFWAEVIGAVKARHPRFIFIADGVGEEAKAILKTGFDYFEDDYFMETLVRQIRIGQVGNLPQMLSGEWPHLLKSAIFNITRLLRPAPSSETIHQQNLLGALILALLPGVIQHDDNLPDELQRFMKWASNSAVFRKGKFSVLKSGIPTVLTFARWKRRSLYIAAANFSSDPQEAVVRLDPLMEGIDENKLYLFNNALHGISPLKNIVDSSEPTNGPALALWGQNLRDSGMPLRLPGLSLKLFSVNLTRPLLSPFSKESVAAVKSVR